MRFFVQELEKAPAVQEYVYGRINASTAKKYMIGFASKKGLLNFIKKEKIPEQYAEELGLVVQTDEGYTVPKFSNRIMIPIVSHGRIVGFGGRTIDNHPAKYINSKTSVLYDKSNVLFGLWQARREIEKCNMAIIVEGYFDVMGLASHNLRIVVSPCGTAFTKGQADLLRRYTNRVLVLFDGDPEGRKAAKRAKKILVSSKIYRGRVFLPNGYDPDDFVEQFGVKSISKLKIRR